MSKSINKEQENLIRALETARQTLSECEQKNKILFEVTSEGIIFHNNRVLIDVNTAFAKMFGYETEELIGKDVIDLVADPDYREILSDNLINDYHKSYEITAQKKDGTVFPVLIGSKKIKYKDEYIVVTSVRDITERKRREEGLQRRNKELELVQNVQSRVPINVDIEQTLQKAVDSIIKLYSYNKVSILTLNHEEKVLEYRAGWNRTGMPTPQGHKQKLGEGLIGKAAWQKETIVANDVTKESDYRIYYQHETKSELTIPLIINDICIGVFDIQDIKLNAFDEVNIATLKSIANYFAYVIDQKQTEEKRKRLEEQLFQAQKMESIGRLAGGVAHDLNNILSGIMGYAELLQMKHKDKSNFEHEAAEVIFMNTERAKSLTNQLLCFARGGHFSPIPVDINELIRGIIKVSKKIFDKNIEVKFDFEESINQVLADKNQLDQVFMNLIINARDAMPNGGELVFNTNNVFVDERNADRYPECSEGSHVKISITDNGIGIPKKIKNHIFEPFFSTKGEGTGLGLATVYGIIKNHGGQIKVYSELGEGTTFNIYLPVTEKKVIEKETKKASLAKGKETILVVDDEEHIRTLVKIQLTSLGYEVLYASDGKEAVKIYKQKKDDINLVLLDMIMPNMDGKETYQKLKQINPDIKVLLMSGFSKNSKTSVILSKGVMGFIQKPFKIHDLSTAINKVFGKKE